jgi:hypothetical protein
MCDHERCSGALRIERRTIVAYIVCDDCGKLLQLLHTHSETASQQAKFLIVLQCS